MTREEKIRAIENKDAKLFESYQITVCSVIRSYSDTDRNEAPSDSNEYMGG